MKAFDLPALAIGIIADDGFVYGKGFGVRRKGGNNNVDTHTLSQIGSATNGFLATTMAIMVDRGRFKAAKRHARGSGHPGEWPANRDPGFPLTRE
jgi:CubicO group peptidase (beta-lactamase class C family)